MDLLERAARTRRQAQAILDDLGLLEKWRRFGRPVLVGAVSFDLAVAPDIDMVLAKNGFIRSGVGTDEGSIRLELSVW
ncbi:MAG: hypothetical protein ACYC0X_13160 [Pirellulaceae bacterium]